MRIPSAATVRTLLALTVVAGCRATNPTPPVEPQAAATPGAIVAPRRYVNADVRFMRHMIGHHDQALIMTGLAATRAASQTVRLVAQRIEVSQRDEIGRMRRWLVERAESVPPVGAEHRHEGGDQQPSMPGMLTPEELKRLSETTATAFDRLFLEFMIRHHEGALVMVSQLFATPGAGQELDIFRFASDVDADQRAEIRRMRVLMEQLSR